MRQLRITRKITNREGSAIDKYFSEIGGEGLLSPDDEVQLAHRIRAGDQDALDRMVKANLRFVISVAKQYQHQGLPLSDLINEGNLGLIKAAMRFDETRGFRFISYAVWWIRQSILQALTEHARIVRLPANKIGALNKLNKIIGQLEQEYQREPTESELAEVLDMKSEEVQDFINSTKTVSIDEPSADGDDAVSMADSLTDLDMPTPEKGLLTESLSKEVKRLLRVLTPKEACVITYFFGLCGSGGKLSYEEIGDKIGLSRERVRQIKDKALRKLRKTRFNRILKVYLG